MPPKAKGAKKKNGYQMAEEFDDGFCLKDIFKTNWTLGKPIGQGGFGLIYLANKGEAKVKQDNAEYVVKIEPKDNGPLFCEIHFYGNAAKEEDIKKFKALKGLKHLAIPRYISSGICTYNEKEYRFLVMDRYLKDLQSVLKESPCLSEIGVLCLMRQVLYALEYIHERGYSHGDVKGANIMLKNDQEAYLVDFGLAYRFQRDGVHNKFDSKPERRHNGTIEYTSRDAHSGAQTYRRSDLEILGYCAMHWLSGTLPWIDMIKNNEQVYKSKTDCMKNVKEFVKNTLGSNSASVRNFMEFYLNEVDKLEFDQEPAYLKIHTKINETLRGLSYSASTDNFMIFSGSKQTKTPKKVTKEVAAAAAAAYVSDEEVHEIYIKKKRSTKDKLESTEKSNGTHDIDTQSKQTLIKPKTPRSVAKINSKAQSNGFSTKHDESSEEEKVDEDSGEDYKPRSRNSKKPRNFQDEEDEQEHGEIMNLEMQRLKKKLISNDTVESKSVGSNENIFQRVPHLNGTPRTPTSRKKVEKQVEDYFNGDDHDHIQEYNEKLTKPQRQIPKTPLCAHNLNEPEEKYLNTKQHETQTKANTEKYNAAQLDMMNSIKLKKGLNQQIDSAKLRSPLALANLDQNNGIMLVKKRRNVPKTTVATQTENSYLAKLRATVPF